jgi:hypothetical protein
VDILLQQRFVVECVCVFFFVEPNRKFVNVRLVALTVAIVGNDIHSFTDLCLIVFSSHFSHAIDLRTPNETRILFVRSVFDFMCGLFNVLFQ